MKTKEEIQKGMVDPDSGAGSFHAVQDTEPEPYQLFRKESYRQWLRYRSLHGHRISITIPYQPSARGLLNRPGVNNYRNKKIIRYCWFFSRRTPHA